MAGPVIQVEGCSRHPGEMVVIPVLLSSILCCPGIFLVSAGSDWTWTQTPELSFRSNFFLAQDRTRQKLKFTE